MVHRDMVTALRPPCGGSSPSGIFRGRSDKPLTVAAPQLHGPVVLPGRGHWTQQERPAEVNAALCDFLNRIDGSASR
ncbi:MULTISPECIES: alpha/beta fold hydrolase [Streptomyces]|uniref:alpha/beta fold hydrolase n=1 Tax=Streptomyces TaxID=1883 RepID=UPI0033B06623